MRTILIILLIVQFVHNQPIQPNGVKDLSRNESYREETFKVLKSRSFVFQNMPKENANQNEGFLKLPIEKMKTFYTDIKRKIQKTILG